MPIKIPNSLPARETLEGENIFVMTEYRAMHQDIRPLNLLILNLMPTKIATETQIARLLGECRERGLSPVGTAMEITMIDDGMTSDPEQFVTEIQIPVGMLQEKGEEQGKKKKFEKSEK